MPSNNMSSSSRHHRISGRAGKYGEEDDGSTGASVPNKANKPKSNNSQPESALPRERKPSGDGTLKNDSSFSSSGSPPKQESAPSLAYPSVSSVGMYPYVSSLDDEISALTSAASTDIDIDPNYSADKRAPPPAAARAPPPAAAFIREEEDEEDLDSKPPASTAVSPSSAAAATSSSSVAAAASASSKSTLYPDVSALSTSEVPSAKFNDFMKKTSMSNKKKAPPPPDASNRKQWPPPGAATSTIARLPGLSEEEQQAKEQAATTRPPPATSPGAVMIPGVRSTEPWVPNNDEEDPDVKSLNPTADGVRAWSSSEEESKEELYHDGDSFDKNSDEDFASELSDDDDGIIKATMVVESADVPEAQAISERGMKRRRRIYIGIAAVCVIGIVVGLVLGLRQDDGEVRVVNETPAPSSTPTASPTDTPRPTLETVVEAQVLRCGVTDKKGFSLENPVTGVREGFDIDLCRAVAAAVLGDPDKIETIVLGGSERFFELRDRGVDLLARVTTHTMERDVHEKNSLVGFSFAAPYLYDGLGFGGVPTYLDCADALTTFGECINMKVCVLEGTTHSSVIGRRLPDESILLVDTRATLYQDFITGICNVIAGEQSDVSESVVRNDAGYTGEYKVGSNLLSKEPLALVVRDDDEEWRSFVSWVFQSLLVAEAQGITSANANDFPGTSLFGPQFSGMFQQAIAAIGNYGDLYAWHLEELIPRGGLNNVNTELNTGLIYSLPFGDLTTEGQGPRGDGAMNAIRQRLELRCGIIERPGTGETSVQGATTQWSGIDTDYCRAVGAALFTGNASAGIVEFIKVADNTDGLRGLADERIDILAGGAVTYERDVSEPNTGLGYAFTAPYFYLPRNSTAEQQTLYGETLSLVTLQDDPDWVDFVSWIVQATFYAEESIIKKSSYLRMPEVSLFGENYTQMLRNAIQEVGNHGEIYSRTVEATFPRNNTANMLNGNPSGPQLYALPGLL